MPPQQPKRLLDLFNQGLNFRAHWAAAFAMVFAIVVRRPSRM
jgi:hypothetical protein